MTELDSAPSVNRYTDRTIARIGEWLGVFTIVSGVALKIVGDLSRPPGGGIVWLQLVGAGGVVVLFAFILDRDSVPSPRVTRLRRSEMIAWAVLPPGFVFAYLPLLDFLRFGFPPRAYKWELFFLALALLFAWRWAGWIHRSGSKVFTLAAAFAIVSGFFTLWIIEAVCIFAFLWGVLSR